MTTLCFLLEREKGRGREIKANDHLLAPIRDAVERAVEAGIPPVAALDCAEKVVRMRAINTSLRAFIVYSSEPDDAPVEPGLVHDPRGDLRRPVNDTEGGPDGD